MALTPLGAAVTLMARPYRVRSGQQPRPYSVATVLAGRRPGRSGRMVEGRGVCCGQVTRGEVALSAPTGDAHGRAQAIQAVATGPDGPARRTSSAGRRGARTSRSVNFWPARALPPSHCAPVEGLGHCPSWRGVKDDGHCLPKWTILLTIAGLSRSISWCH